MVFVPFTGVDNHKRCITFGAALITKEDTDSYVWVLESFKDAMGTAPSCFVTDQDPAMKSALEQVYPGSRHRFYMWHIMTKVSEKVGPVLSNDEVFRRKLNSIVWDEKQQPDVFESRWEALLGEYGLLEQKWFAQLWEAREFWIPAYFKDMPLSSMVRTTSRSEGQNSFFGRYLSKNASLVEFFSHFQSAMDAQRNTQSRLNAGCEGHYAPLKTPLHLERHASTVYTIKIFHEVQSEIYACCFYCSVVSIQPSGEVINYCIKDSDEQQFNVCYNSIETTATCTCLLFQRIGWLCRHIFLVFKDARIDNIPSRYIVDRWTRRVCLRQEFELNGVTVDLNATNGATKTMENKMWSEIFACVGLAITNPNRVEQITRVVQQQKETFIGESKGSDGLQGKNPMIQSFCGTIPSSAILVKPPPMAKNKGSGKRIKGKREKAIEQVKKGGRKCNGCGKREGHNSRSCPVLKGLL